MSDPASQLNVPTDAPIGVYRTPDVGPRVDESSAVIVPAAQAPVRNSDGVTFGGMGVPLNPGG